MEVAVDLFHGGPNSQVEFLIDGGPRSRKCFRIDGGPAVAMVRAVDEYGKEHHNYKLIKIEG